MIKKKEFMESVTTLVTEALRQEGMLVENAEVKEVLGENNSVHHGMTIYLENTNVVPNIYLDDYYKDYENGVPPENIVQEVKKLYIDRIGRTSLINDSMLEFERNKDKIIFQVVGIKNNREMLLNEKHTRIGNGLAFVYKLAITNNMLVPITNKFAAEYGYKDEELYDLAMENTPKIFPKKIEDIGILTRTLSNGSKSSMLVVTNEELFHGASVFFYPGVKEEIAATLNDSYYVIPSSVHDLIITPCNIDKSLNELKFILDEGNKHFVAEDEVLSNDVYHYDKEKQRFDIADKVRTNEDRGR